MPINKLTKLHTITLHGNDSNGDDLEIELSIDNGSGDGCVVDATCDLYYDKPYNTINLRCNYNKMTIRSIEKDVASCGNDDGMQKLDEYLAQFAIDLEAK